MTHVLFLPLFRLFLWLGRRNVLGWAAGIALSSYALTIQFTSYLGQSVAKSLTIAQHMLAGKQLYFDLHDFHLPLLHYIRMGAVALGQLIGSVPNAANICDTFLCSVSLLFSYLVIRQTKEYLDAWFRFICIITLFFVLFVLPLLFVVTAFGQAEHLFVALFLPYLCSYMLTDHQRQQQPLFIFIIRMMAVVGLCLKITFFLIPLFIELYRVIKARHIGVCVHGGSLLIVFCGLLFFSGVALYFPLYFSDMLPQYHLLYTTPIEWKFPTLHFPLNSWLYGKLYWLRLMFFYGLFFFIIPLCFIRPFQSSSRFFSFFGAVFFACFVAYIAQPGKNEHFFYPCVAMAMLCCIPVWSRVGLKASSLPPKNHGAAEYVRPLFLAVIFILLIASLMGERIGARYSDAMVKKQQIDDVLALARKHQDSLLFIGHHNNIFFPASLYSKHLDWDGRFSKIDLWRTITRIQKKISKSRSPASEDRLKKLQQLKKHIEPQLVDHIIEQNPAVIAVNTGSIYKDVITQEYYTISGFNYINLLSKNARFAAFWKQYKLKEHVTLYDTTAARGNLGSGLGIYIRQQKATP